MFFKKSIEELNKRIEFLESKVDWLDADIFEINYPNGKIDYGRFDSYCHYLYSNNREISNIALCRIGESIISYASRISGDTVYIALQTKSDKKYFIIDIYNKTSIECRDENMFTDLNWKNETTDMKL